MTYRKFIQFSSNGVLFTGEDSLRDLREGEGDPIDLFLLSMDDYSAK